MDTSVAIVFGVLVAAMVNAPRNAGAVGVIWRAALFAGYVSVAFVRPKLAFVVLLLVFAHRIWLRRRRQATRTRLGVAPDTTLVGFFHPFCASGGGGERVLWKMLHTLSEQHAAGALKVHVVVYAADGNDDWAAVLSNASRRFGIDLSGAASRAANRNKEDSGSTAAAANANSDSIAIDCVLVPAWVVKLLTAEVWPRFTMVGQSFGSLAFTAWALLSELPDTWVDTTGAAFSLPLARIGFGCQCAAYVHYPTISTDMLRMVSSQRPSYNHDAAVASSQLRSAAKLIYYAAFAAAYALAGAAADLVMVNSSWTCGHIAWLWRFSPWPIVLYPPCGVQDFMDQAEGDAVKVTTNSSCDSGGSTSVSRKRELVKPSSTAAVRHIVSVGQFRPEKDHPLQLHAFALLLKELKPEEGEVRLVLLGSCRDSSDEARVADLKQLAEHLEVASQVDFALNVPFQGPNGIVAWLKKADVGLHTMWNEHFGIGVVEMLAAGLVTVAHDSAGPQMDIVKPALPIDDNNGDARKARESRTGVGFLAHDAASYAAALARALRLTPSARHALVEAAQQHSLKFSDSVFANHFADLVTGPKHGHLFGATQALIGNSGGSKRDD